MERQTAALTDGTRTVTASVSDPAGNEGTDSQLLTVDTAAPAVTITGGANALTNDATPQISGTADVAPGTTVTVTLADETLTALVDAGGAWSVTAAALSDGPHRVVMSVSDAAGNPASFTQTLTVDTVSPVVAITGGATATTSDLDPTIAGTSDAAPGTTVTVSIAGQTMTTLVQANGSWNATPTVVGEGTWPVVASAPDPAGNRAPPMATVERPMELAPDRPNVELRRGAEASRSSCSRFPYDAHIVNVVRGIPGRRFDWDAREWWAPVDDWVGVHVADVLERFPDLTASAEVDAWLAQIQRALGRRTSSTVRHDGRGWWVLATRAGTPPEALLDGLRRARRACCSRR